MKSFATFTALIVLLVALAAQFIMKHWTVIQTLDYLF